MPDNGQVSATSTHLLADAGIRVIGIAGQLRLDQWLAAEGHRLHAAFLARHHVATRHIALIRALSKAQVLFDTVDLHHIRLQRAAELQNDASAARTAERVRSEEMRLIDAADTTLVVSGTEVDYLHTQGVTRSRISVLSNIHDPQRNSRSYADTRDLLFVGGFLHHPNREAVEWLRSQVMPLLRLRLTGITLHVVGDMPDEDAQRIRCADIQVHGHVATLEPHLAAARISLAPLLSGAGVKGKINQAMSHGLPVVATSIAAEGMFLQHGHDALIADGATAFAAEVARLYEDEQLWMKLSGNGYDNVEKHFSSDLARSTLLQLIGHPDRMGPAVPHP